MEQEEQKWDQELEEDEKEEDSLEVRRSRARNEAKSMGSAAEEDTTQLDSSNSKTNGHVVHPSESVTNNVVEELVLDQSKEKEGLENVVAPSGNGVPKETEITEGQSKSNNCVYYDKDEEHIEKNHGDDVFGITTVNVGAKNLTSVLDYQHEGVQKNVNLSNPQHSEMLPEECTTSYIYTKVTEIETADIDLADESDVEGAELDVERVLQKQNTHDLYCPNCNSCITRRVILRKRKRGVRITSEHVKRNKLDTLTESAAKATSDQGHDTGDIHLGGTSELAANDNEREREPDIFRCLSCFSIFIPTGKGFKLFRIFGDKSKKNTTEDQQISSSLLSDKDRITAGSGSDFKGDAPKTSSKENMPSSNLNDLINQTAAQGDGDKVLSSPVKQQLMHEKVMPSAGNISSGAKTMRKGDGVKNNFEVAIGNQPNTSNASKDVAYFQGDQSVAVSTNRTPASKGESQKDSSSLYQPDGLKLLISANVGSTAEEKLQKDQNPDLKVQNIGSDMQSILSMPPKASEHIAVDMNGNKTTKVKTFHEQEQNVGTMVPKLPAYENGTQDKLSNNDGASSHELPQQIITNNKVEIHAGEQIKVDKDALVLSIKDPILKQADTVKDLKKMTTEYTAGKDTVSVVEAGPSKIATSRWLQDPNASAEIGTSRHVASDVEVGERMGADAGEAFEIEIIKSIVYGGLVESITSLGVVSSAAGGGTATLNILALAVANLIGGLVLVGHNLWELKKNNVVGVPNRVAGQIDRYKELLGRRENFVVHATVAVLSFIVFGIISPITYAFSFRKSDDRDLKIIVAGAASLLCIILLATGKASVRKPTKSYCKTIGYYVLLGFIASGISYAAGELIKRLLDKFHVLESNSLVNVPFTETRPDASLWSSY